MNEKLEQELQHREAQLKLQEEKTKAIQERLDLSDQKLDQFSKMPEMEEELKQRLQALTQVPNKLYLTVNKSLDLIGSYIFIIVQNSTGD